MSVLDCNIDFELESYYKDKIVNFFKENGPFGTRDIRGRRVGVKSNIIDKFLFIHYPLTDIINDPEAFALYSTYAGGSYYLKVIKINEPDVRLQLKIIDGWRQVLVNGRVFDSTLKYII